MQKKIYKTSLRSVFLCFLMFLLLPCMGFTGIAQATSATAAAPDIAKIDAFMRSEMQANHLPGLALGIVHGDQVVHLRGFGVADPTGRAVTPQTPFVIGSVSKSFTAMAIMQLVEAGKVQLDAPVQRYLPWFRVADAAASARITVRNLLNHSSGMPTGAGESAALRTETLAQFVRNLNTVALTAPVGTTFQYSNANYMTLGLIVQTVSGQDYGAYIQQHILNPLQMQHSYISVPEARQHGLAQGYHWLFGNPYPVEDPDLHYPALLPAGLLISSAEDMSHYLIAQMNNGQYGDAIVLSQASIAAMHAPAIPVKVLGASTSYGMGWFNGPVGGIPAVWHDGVTGAFNTYMIMEPGTRWGAIVMINAVSLLADVVVYSHLQAGLARLLAGQEPPLAGISLGSLYLLLEGILALISIAALWFALRLRHWYKRFQERKRLRFLRLAGRLFWELPMPVLLYLGFPLFIGVTWLNFLLLNPDLGYWFLGICAFAFITGLVRLVLAIIALRRKKTIAPPTSSANLSSGPALV